MAFGDDGRMKYTFTEEEIAEIQEARRKNRDKNVDRRLKALVLKAEGHTGQEIAEMTGYNSGYISKLAAKYRIVVIKHILLLCQQILHGKANCCPHRENP